jgi:hypothetical protein
VRSIAAYAVEKVEEQARSHPFRTLGVAMGVGYVLGGGIPKILVRLGLLAAGRVLTDAITTEGLRSLSTNLMGATDGEDEDQAQSTGGARGGRAKNGHQRKRQGAERHARRD